jgi:hypothetical protein
MVWYFDSLFIRVKSLVKISSATRPPSHVREKNLVAAQRRSVFTCLLGKPIAGFTVLIVKTSGTLSTRCDKST